MEGAEDDDANAPATGAGADHRVADVDEAAGEIVLVIHWKGGQHDQDIPASLNRMGMPTGQGKTWTAKRVGDLRRVHGIHGYRSADKKGEWLTLRFPDHCQRPDRRYAHRRF